MASDRTIRNLSAPADDEGRVETGAIQFGDDWPGLFVRGDGCAALWIGWQLLMAHVGNLPGAVEITTMPLRALMDTIRDDVDLSGACKRWEARAAARKAKEATLDGK